MIVHVNKSLLNTQGNGYCSHRVYYMSIIHYLSKQHTICRDYIHHTCSHVRPGRIMAIQ